MAEKRPPLRGRGVQPRPTLQQARARRAAEQAPAAPRGEPRRETDTAPTAKRPQPGPAPRSRPRPRPDHDPVGASSPTGDAGIRLSKRMSELGLASRREADAWIEAGRVRVDGRIVDTLGARVRPGQSITIDRAAAAEQRERVTVLLHKPLGYVSGQAEDGYEPAVVLVRPEQHWRGDRSGRRFSRAHLRSLAPAGRLDIDSTGLLVLTQDGRIAKLLIGEDSGIEKEYLVRVRSIDRHGTPAAHDEDLMHAFPPERLELLRHGLELDGQPLRPAKVSWQNESQLRFVLREGKKRQIRRMCEAVGLAVVGLKRVRIGKVVLGDLPPGQWRYLGPFESF